MKLNTVAMAAVLLLVPAHSLQANFLDTTAKQAGAVLATAGIAGGIYRYITKGTKEEVATKKEQAKHLGLATGKAALTAACLFQISVQSYHAGMYYDTIVKKKHAEKTTFGTVKNYSALLGFIACPAAAAAICAKSALNSYRDFRNVASK